MAGLTQAMQQQALDNVFPTTGSTDHIAWASDAAGTAALVPRTAVGATGWAAATAATPSVKANANALTSGDATGATTVTHWATFSASSGGTQKSDWQAVTSPRTLATGDRLTIAAGSLQHTLD